MIPTSQKISRVYNMHVMPTLMKWRTPHTINYCLYSLQLTRWTLFYLLGRACPKHPRYGSSNELCLLVHSVNLFCFCFFMFFYTCYTLYIHAYAHWVTAMNLFIIQYPDPWGKSAIPNKENSPLCPGLGEVGANIDRCIIACTLMGVEALSMALPLPPSLLPFPHTLLPSYICWA